MSSVYLEDSQSKGIIPFSFAKEKSLHLCSKHPTAITSMAIGIILSLTGIFIVLAASQVLPHGVNAISQFGIGGKITGYVLLGWGLCCLGYGLVCRAQKNKKYLNQKNGPRPPLIPSVIEDVKHTEMPEKPSEIAEELRHERHRDSSLGKDCEMYVHGSPQSALKGRDCSLAQVQEEFRESPTNVPSSQPSDNHFQRNPENVPKIVPPSEQIDRNLLADSLFEKAKQYIDDPTMLAKAAHPVSGASRETIYIPNDLPIVIRDYKNKQGNQRFFKMKEAYTLCEKLQAGHLEVPKARLYETYLIEEKLPNQHGAAIPGMAFYFENHHFFTKAVLELTAFLCYANVTDIVGNDGHKLKNLNISLIPRFDNLLLYCTEEDDKKIYKIGLIDLETLDLTSLPPTLLDVKNAMSQTIQLFPYHFEKIIELGKTFCQLSSETIEELRKLSEKSQELYQIVCSGNLSFYQKNNITPQNQLLAPITEKRKEEIKKQLSMSFSNRKFFKNSDGVTRRFEEEAFPQLIALLQNKLVKIHTVRCEDKQLPLSYGELIDKRLFAGPFTQQLYNQVATAPTNASLRQTLDEIWTEDMEIDIDYFKEILELLAQGGELAFYRRKDGHDFLFF